MAPEPVTPQPDGPAPASTTSWQPATGPEAVRFADDLIRELAISELVQRQLARDDPDSASRADAARDAPDPTIGAVQARDELAAVNSGASDEAVLAALGRAAKVTVDRLAGDATLYNDAMDLAVGAAMLSALEPTEEVALGRMGHAEAALDAAAADLRAANELLDRRGEHAAGAATFDSAPEPEPGPDIGPDIGP